MLQAVQTDTFPRSKTRKGKRGKYKAKPLAKNNMELMNIQPLNERQEQAFAGFEQGDHLVLHGSAGTGKTFIAMYLALQTIQRGDYTSVVIVRSAVPSRDIGFLPGKVADKTAIYEAPYYDLTRDLFNRSDAYDVLKSKGTIEFTSTSFTRGLTLDNCVVIIDEAQNMSDMELHTLITRIGKNTRVIVCGDIRQDDLTSERKKEMSGLRNFLRILEQMNEFTFVTFTSDDIVRSDFVKQYLITRERIGL